MKYFLMLCIGVALIALGVYTEPAGKVLVLLGQVVVIISLLCGVFLRRS